MTNSGRTPVPRADVVVSDPQLADLAPDDGGTDGGLLGPGDSVTYAGTRVASVEDCGPLPNTATVALRGGKRGLRDGEPANDSATHWVDVAGAACAPKVPDSVLNRPAPPPAVRRARGHAPEPAGRLPAAEAARPHDRAAAARRRPGRPLHRRGPQRRGRAAARRARLTLRLPEGFSLATRTRRTTIENGAMPMELGTLAARRSRVVSVILRADHPLGHPSPRGDGVGGVRRRARDRPGAREQGRPGPGAPAGRRLNGQGGGTGWGRGWPPLALDEIFD